MDEQDLDNGVPWDTDASDAIAGGDDEESFLWFFYNLGIRRTVITIKQLKEIVTISLN